MKDQDQFIGILVSNCCKTNYHKLGNLKGHTYIISWLLLNQQTQFNCAGFIRDSQGYHPGISLAAYGLTRGSTGWESVWGLTWKNLFPCSSRLRLLLKVVLSRVHFYFIVTYFTAWLSIQPSRKTVVHNMVTLSHYLCHLALVRNKS